MKGYPTFLVTFPHLNKRVRVHPFKKDSAMTTEQSIEALRKEIEGAPK